MGAPVLETSKQRLDGHLPGMLEQLPALIRELHWMTPQGPFQLWCSMILCVNQPVTCLAQYNCECAPSAFRPQNGSMILYNRKKVKYRKDGYCWKKRKDGKTTREDHMKLKVQGVEVSAPGHVCFGGCHHCPGFVMSLEQLSPCVAFTPLIPALR